MATEEIAMDMEETFYQETPERIEMEADAGWRGVLHPLLIDHVFEKVIHHLLHQNEDDNVLRMRLVCHHWNKIATTALRFHSNKSIYFGKYFRSADSLLEFVNFLHSSHSHAMENFPLGKFYLCEDIFKECHSSSVQRFFTECSNIITNLSVRLDNHSDLVRVCPQLNFDGKWSLPHLKSLCFDDRRYILSGGDPSSYSQTENPSLLECLVKSSPNLRKFTVIHPPSSIFDDPETIFLQNEECEKNVAEMLLKFCPPQLKYLNLDIKLTDKVLLSLNDLPANLTELSLSLRESSTFSKDSLSKLLFSQKDSLQKLHLLSMGTKSHFEIIFPPLPHLRLLELHSWDSQIGGVTLSKFAYSENFPHLQSLVLHTWAENPSWAQFFPAAYFGTVPSLTSLKLPQNFMNPAMIQNLSWLYPNLTSLDLHFSKETAPMLQRVFHAFGDQLQELRIRGNLPREKFDVCLDPLFTGIPKSTCDKILRTKMFDPRAENNYLLRFKSRPSLLNLKSLRKLDIEDILRHEAYVTDVTGYLVLLEMPSLAYLHMGRSQIDDECLEQLARKYPQSMEKELLVPKPPSKISQYTRSKLNAYYCSSKDLINQCVIC